MNVLVLPSWYPHRCFPVEGSFIRDQAIAIGELRPDWNVAIADWHPGANFLSLAHLRKSPRCVVEALTRRHTAERVLRPNVVEFEQPALGWPERIAGGNRAGILRAARAALARATARFGSIDVLHAHVSFPAGWVALRLRDETGIPCVVTEHQAPFPLAVYANPDGSLRPALREPLARADARIAVSPALAARIASFGLPEPEFVPNLIDEREFALSPTSGDTFTSFTLGTMEPRKGIDELLEAIARVVTPLGAAERATLRFRFGGDGPSVGDFRAHATRLGLDDVVTWLGALTRADARAEFERCDCFALTSRQESFGIVFAEAAACGKPLIATPCGGPEVIVHPGNGVLVPIGDVERIAEALRFMRANARGFDPASIRADCVARFGRAAVVAKLEAIYRRVSERALNAPRTRVS